MRKSFESVTVENLPLVAEWFLKEALPVVKERAYFVALHGDLGTGKTTFVKEVAKLLEIKEEVISPTFILKKEYNVSFLEVEKIVHIDAYRFEQKKESVVLALSDNDVPKTLLFIEWPEKIEDKRYDAELYFEYKDEETRKIEIHVHEK